MPLKNCKINFYAISVVRNESVAKRSISDVGCGPMLVMNKEINSGLMKSTIGDGIWISRAISPKSELWTVIERENSIRRSRVELLEACFQYQFRRDGV